MKKDDWVLRVNLKTGKMEMELPKYKTYKDNHFGHMLSSLIYQVGIWCATGGFDPKEVKQKINKSIDDAMKIVQKVEQEATK